MSELSWSDWTPISPISVSHRIGKSFGESKMQATAEDYESGTDAVLMVGFSTLQKRWFPKAEENPDSFAAACAWLDDLVGKYA